MNLEKVIFGFFVILACTLNFGFFIDALRTSPWMLPLRFNPMSLIP